MHEPGTPDLTGLLLSTRTLETFLDALAQSAMDFATGSDGCGITLERGNRPLTVASTGASADRMDEKQYGQNDGPCLEALRTGREVSVTDMSVEDRWGEYPAFAVAQGTHSSLSLPLLQRGDTAGALNLYSPRARGFRDVDVRFLRALAAEASGAIALAQQMADAEEFAADLKAALVSRTVIDQAIGVVMAQQRCSPQQAFELLRQASQHRNVKLRKLCEDMVGRFGGPPEGPEPRPRP
ncbi:GAF and ANTAR domain-containing protein [Actinacidiphila yanglinensis]|nr:GAF and ANTAR domain-containing protein [Actinacidiphila yanglinensis]